MKCADRSFRRDKKRGARFLRLVSAMVLSFAASSCASTGAVVAPERARGYSAPASASEGMIFVPAGAYIVGREAQNLPVGAWLRALPGASRPSDAPKPTLLVGRIASKEPFGARVEILAAQPTIRDTHPTVEFYSNNQKSGQTKNKAETAAVRLHAMPKRLVYPLTEISPSDELAAAGLGASDLVEGSEIYAIVALRGGAQTRLASQMTGLGTIAGGSLNRDEIAVTRVAGAWPDPGTPSVSGDSSDSAAFVFLDAPDVPAYGARISVYGAGLSDLKTEIEALLTDRLPGRQHIRTEYHASALPETSVSDMSQSETDMLEIRVFAENGQIAFYDQGARVSRAPQRSPLRSLPPSDPSVAAAIAMQALSMIGYWASAAFIGEQAWRDAGISAKSALAPALAQAYRAMGRTDWAFEIGLELAGYARRADGKTKYEALAAQAAVMSICRRSAEFSSVYDAVYRNIGKLSPEWQRSFRFALSSSERPEHGAMLRTLLRKRGDAEAPLSEIEDWLICLNAFADDYALSDGAETAQAPVSRYGALSDYCETKGQNARLPLFNAAFEALALIADLRERRLSAGGRTDEAADNARLEEMLSLSSQIDALGYPDLSAALWREIALNASGGEAVLIAWQNAAEYARLAQQKRLYLQMTAEAARWMRENNMTPARPGFGRAIAGWRALDMREPLAAMYASRAQTADGAAAGDLLNAAADLFLSMGDFINCGAIRALETNSAPPEGSAP